MNDITYITEQEIQGVYKTHIVPRNNSSTGYGPKVPTQYMLKVGRRLHRVYCMIYSNSGSCYIIKDGKRLFTGQVEHMFETANIMDRRYKIMKAFYGAAKPGYIVDFCNEFVGTYKTLEDAEYGVTCHYNNRH